MDPIVFKLLNEKIDKIDEKTDSIEAKVDTLLEFKWKVVGGTILASLLLTGAFKILELTFK
jgi:hypothetical protein